MAQSLLANHLNLRSRYFNVAEFGCHSGEPYPEAWQDRLEALCSQLDVIRADWGGPVRIVSGYRTPAWNLRIAGAKLSQHVSGYAADIQPMVPATSMHASIISLNARILRLMSESKLPLVGGLGYYPNRWLHIDVRAKPPNGHVARWDGTGVGSEQTA